MKASNKESADRTSIELTKEFWNSHPCDGDFDSSDNHEKYRYLKDYMAPAVIENNIIAGGKTLEIGCGQGADLALLAKKSKHATGIDLAPEGVARASERLTQKGIKNFSVMVANAESLPFEDKSFDSVYSWGVMHHTIGTQECIDETYRVLRPNGVAVILLYRSWSPQYVFAKTFRGVTYPIRKSLGELVSTSMFHNSRFFGTALAEMFGAPIFKGFSYSEIQRMFSRFSEIRVERYNTGFARLRLLVPESPRMLRILERLEEITSDKLGFYNVIVARK